MGNFSSCLSVKLQKATLIDDLQGNIRHIKVPITAAEMMLLEAEPGQYLISPVDDLRSTFRLSALRADDVLRNGKLYVLIPSGRLNSFITQSELEMLQSTCKIKQVKVKRRRSSSSKVLPQNEVGDCEGSGDVTGQRMGSSPMWKPVLEPIYE